MKTIDRIPFLSNVLIVACTRMNNSDVGKLVKAVVAYATDGSRPAMDDLRLETYFDLIAQDLDSLRTAAEVKSRSAARVLSVGQRPRVSLDLPIQRRRLAMTFLLR